jgi:hypothetical protein
LFFLAGVADGGRAFMERKLMEFLTAVDINTWI